VERDERWGNMARIEAEVLVQYFKALEEHEAVDKYVVDGLRKALSGDRLPRVEALAELFSNASGDTLA
jgi:hypothetical protein